MDESQRLRLWEMEHWPGKHERPNSAERERRIARLQREKFDREERIRHINYPIKKQHHHDHDEEEERRLTRPSVSPELLKPTFASQAKIRGPSYASPVRGNWSHINNSSPHGGSAAGSQERYSQLQSTRPGGYRDNGLYFRSHNGPYFYNSPRTYEAQGSVTDRPYYPSPRNDYGRSGPADEMGIIPSIVRRQEYPGHDLGAARHLKYTSWGSQYSPDETAYGYDYDDPSQYVHGDEEMPPGHYQDGYPGGYESPRERVPSPRPPSPRRQPSPHRLPSPRQPPVSRHQPAEQQNYGQVPRYTPRSANSSVKVRTNRAQQLREQHNLAKELAAASNNYW